jgi:hypothetical protein
LVWQETEIVAKDVSKNPNRFPLLELTEIALSRTSEIISAVGV